MRLKSNRPALRPDRPDQGLKNDRALNDERFCGLCDLKNVWTRGSWVPQVLPSECLFSRCV